MVNSRGRIFCSSIDSLPDTVSGDIDFPDVSDSFRACITSIQNDIRFKIGHYMSISCARGGSLAVFDLPVGFVG